MKLQIAIDRVTLSKAEEMAKIFAGKTDSDYFFVLCNGGSYIRRDEWTIT